jgi:phospholipid-transporting ATPase
LLKGSSLRNTDWIYGITIYTGHDTKLMKNMKPRKTKNGYVEMRLNFLLGGLLLMHQVLTILFVILSSLYQVRFYSFDLTFLELGRFTKLVYYSH